MDRRSDLDLVAVSVAELLPGLTTRLDLVIMLKILRTVIELGYNKQ